MLPPFHACIKITYHPAWIPYCNTIRRDRAGNYASSPYHAVFSYSNSVSYTHLTLPTILLV